MRTGSVAMQQCKGKKKMQAGIKILLTIAMFPLLCSGYPYSVNITDIKATSAVIHWKTTELQVEEFLIQCVGTQFYAIARDGRVHNTEMHVRSQFVPQGLEGVRIGDLRPNYNYTCVIQETLPEGAQVYNGILSRPVTFTSDYSNPAAPSAPVIVKQDGITRVNLHKSPSTKYGPITGYRVQFHVIENSFLGDVSVIDREFTDPFGKFSPVTIDYAQTSPKAISFQMSYTGNDLPSYIQINSDLMEGALKNGDLYRVVTVAFTQCRDGTFTFTPSPPSDSFVAVGINKFISQGRFLSDVRTEQLKIGIVAGVVVPLVCLLYMCCIGILLLCREKHLGQMHATGKQPKSIIKKTALLFKTKLLDFLLCCGVGWCFLSCCRRDYKKLKTKPSNSVRFQRRIVVPHLEDTTESSTPTSDEDNIYTKAPNVSPKASPRISKKMSAQKLDYAKAWPYNESPRSTPHSLLPPQGLPKKPSDEDVDENIYTKAPNVSPRSTSPRTFNSRPSSPRAIQGYRQPRTPSSQGDFERQNIYAPQPIQHNRASTYMPSMYEPPQWQSTHVPPISRPPSRPRAPMNPSSRRSPSRTARTPPPLQKHAGSATQHSSPTGTGTIYTSPRSQPKSQTGTGTIYTSPRSQVKSQTPPPPIPVHLASPSSPRRHHTPPPIPRHTPRNVPTPTKPYQSSRQGPQHATPQRVSMSRHSSQHKLSQHSKGSRRGSLQQSRQSSRSSRGSRHLRNAPWMTITPASSEANVAAQPFSQFSPHFEQTSGAQPLQYTTSATGAFNTAEEFQSGQETFNSQGQNSELMFLPRGYSVSSTKSNNNSAFEIISLSSSQVGGGSERSDSGVLEILH